MSIRKNCRGKWIVDIHFESADGIKTRIRRISPVQSHRGAEKYERTVRMALLDGSYRSKRNRAPTLAAYLPDYLRDLQSRGRKPTTLKSAEGLFRNWILPHVGGRRVDEVRTADFSTVRMAMAEVRRSAKTTNNAPVALSAIVRHWHAEHDRPAPAFRVGLVKVAKKEASFYTDPQVARLCEAARTLGADAEVLLLLGVDAGLRMSEIRALQWSDLSLHGRATVTVSRTREGDEEYAPKGWSSRVSGGALVGPIDQRPGSARAQPSRSPRAPRPSWLPPHAPNGGAAVREGEAGGGDRARLVPRDAAYVLHETGRAGRAVANDPGAGRPRRPGHHAEVHARDSGRSGCRDREAGRRASGGSRCDRPLLPPPGYIDSTSIGEFIRGEPLAEIGPKWNQARPTRDSAVLP